MAKKKIQKNRVALSGMKKKLGSLKKYLPVFEKQRAALNRMLQEEELIFQKLTSARETLLNEIDPWISLFNDSEVDISEFIRLKSIDTDKENIFGTSVPKFNSVSFDEFSIDYQYYPLWVEDGIAAVKKVVETDAKLAVSKERTAAIRRGYEQANQKVNLFDKKLIPETEESIREIKSALDAQGVAAIVIAKSAKKLQERKTAA
ncbi:MAG: hypothetical protein JXX29_13165 [Deltaproteobacteria bacterium]|nr:hypothetical protein [Deltaproteobacteria bacterium]MBN2672628.1 hypothetical protein [Deltaproteobacteria bacterium]